MKTLTPVLVAMSMVLFPVGLALAKDGGGNAGSPPPRGGLGIFQHLETNLEFMWGHKGNGNDEGVRVTASTSAQVDTNDDATTTRRGPRPEDVRNIREDRPLRPSATSTRPFATSTLQHGNGDFEHGSSTASTTKNYEGFGKGGIPAFLRWLFGLPATTTIGDIRAQIGATTTASTTGGISTPMGLGFWAHLFDFFHFGGNN